MALKEKSKYSQLYKERGDLDEAEKQENRRRQLLDEQKRLRAAKHDDGRNIKEFIAKIHRRRNHRKKFSDENSLQFSEWMKDRPENLNDWLVVPCPKGQRCLLIASAGATELYNKYGRLIKSFRTNLPGDRISSRQQSTILDCILNKSDRKLFVLDVIGFGCQDLIECDTQFRFYWLKTKLSEIENGVDSEFEFVPLEYYDMADRETTATDCFQRYPHFDNNNPELDGYLFYHKDASYVHGTTPLVLWLFSFMVPEVLGYDIHPSYQDAKPEDYVDYLHFIVEFDEALRRKKMKFVDRKQRQRSGEKMEETCEIEENVEEMDDSVGRDDPSYDVESIVDHERLLEVEGIADGS